jgi:uncharacterized membrane protein
MNFDEEHYSGNQRWTDYLDSTYTIWLNWHTSAIILYYIGLVLFILGTDVLLFIYISKRAAILVIAILLFAVYFGFVLEMTANEIKDNNWAQRNT